MRKERETERQTQRQTQRQRDRETDRRDVECKTRALSVVCRSCSCRSLRMSCSCALSLSISAASPACTLLITFTSAAGGYDRECVMKMGALCHGLRAPVPVMGGSKGASAVPTALESFPFPCSPDAADTELRSPARRLCFGEDCREKDFFLLVDAFLILCCGEEVPFTLNPSARVCGTLSMVCGSVCAGGCVAE